MIIMKNFIKLINLMNLKNVNGICLVIARILKLYFIKKILFNYFLIKAMRFDQLEK